MRKLLVIALLALIVGCKATVKEDAIKVVYFMEESRSETCKAIEKLTKEVLDKDFAKELKKGEFTFEVIDTKSDEGKKLAKDYETSGSGLYISQTIEGKKSQKDLSRLGYIFATSEPDNYKKEIKAVFTAAKEKGVGGMGAVRPKTKIEGC